MYILVLHIDLDGFVVIWFDVDYIIRKDMLPHYAYNARFEYGLQNKNIFNYYEILI